MWRLLPLLVATPAMAELQLTTQSYSCDRGVVIPVAYVSDGVDSVVATLMFDGRMFSLVGQAIDGSVRYAWPSDGSGYVWVASGTSGVLSWKDAGAGNETPLMNCTALE